MDGNHKSADGDHSPAVHSESETAFLHHMLDNTDELIIVIDPRGTLLYANAALARQLDKNVQELIGECIYEYFDASTAVLRAEQADQCLKKQKTLYYNDTHGDRHWTAKVVPLPGGRVMISAHDITLHKRTENNIAEASDELARVVAERTAELERANRRLQSEIEERKKAEKEIQKARDFLQTVIDEIPHPLAIKDREHRWILISRVICGIFNKNIEDMLGKTDHDFIRGEEADIFRRIEEQVFETGEANVNEEVVTEPSGRRRWQVTQKSLFRDKEENKYILAIAYDITDRRRAEEELRRHREHLEELVLERTAELNKANEQLLQSQKMEAIGQLAGGIAHEFNNILAVVLVTSDILLRKCPADDADRQKLERILKACERAKGLTAKLLAFARKEKLDLRRVPVHEILADVADMLGITVSKKIKLEINMADAGIEIVGDVNQITQALLNLCLNACDAMPNGGALTLCAGIIEPDEEFLRARPKMLPGPHCLIKVRDTGLGISEQLRDRIFEPFFTTKERGHGTGLGLSVTLGIINMHNGDITIHSEPGHGTTARVYLPMLTETADSTETMGELSVRSGSGGSVLVVDDEEDFLEIMKEALAIEGYGVLAATNGKQAINIFQSRAAEIDLVILDIMMPGLDGADVFSALKNIRDDVRVVICSGYSVRGIATELLEKGALAFIPKPYPYDDLFKLIRQVIEK